MKPKHLRIVHAREPWTGKSNKQKAAAWLRPLEIHHKEMLLPWYVQIENKRDEKP